MPDAAVMIPSALAPRCVRSAVSAMGTRFECVIVVDERGPQHAQAAAEAAWGEIVELHGRWSPFERASEVTRVNEEASSRSVRVSRDLIELLEIARGVWRDSHGAFDVTMGAVMRRQGFHPPTSRDAHAHESRSAHDSPRAPALLEAPVWGMEHLQCDQIHSEVRFARDGLALDLGAIAKGWALDVAAGVLQESGVRAALIHGGTSSVFALGAPPGMQAWRVRLGRDAEAPTIALRDQALSVSELDGRVIETGTETLSHILDPRAARTPEPRALAACVVGPGACLCDAWSTALLVLGARPDALPDAYLSMMRTDRGWFEIPAPKGDVDRAGCMPTRRVNEFA